MQPYKFGTKLVTFEGSKLIRMTILGHTRMENQHYKSGMIKYNYYYCDNTDAVYTIFADTLALRRPIVECTRIL